MEIESDNMYSYTFVIFCDSDLYPVPLSSCCLVFYYVIIYNLPIHSTFHGQLGKIPVFV